MLKETLHRWTNLLAPAIAGLSAGGDGGSWCSAAAALSCAVVTQDFSLVSLLPHGRRVRLAHSAAGFQTQRHRRLSEKRRRNKQWAEEAHSAPAVYLNKDWCCCDSSKWHKQRHGYFLYTTDRLCRTSYDSRLLTVTPTTLNGNLGCLWSWIAAIVAPLFLLLLRWLLTSFLLLYLICEQPLTSSTSAGLEDTAPELNEIKF